MQGADFVWFLLIMIIIFFGVSLRRKKKAQEKAMGAYESAGCLHEYGIPQLKPKQAIDIYLTPEKLVVKSKDLTFELPIERVMAAQYLTKTDFLKQDKSVIARGVVGGVLIGPLGAIVGGMSGVGSKHKKGNYLVINYKTPDSSEPKVLIFNVFLSQVATDLSEKLTMQITLQNTNSGVIEL
ncbi:hypothetical protein EEL32_24080 [Brevibacillus laterosporus]|nr:hypothetical protein [Brevibacillus laterosporus]TPG75610.1 hypothetical protein EEL32_24080 [Brevibacillus laterosporus]